MISSPTAKSELLTVAKFATGASTINASIFPFLSVFTWFLLLYYYIKLHSLVKKRKAFIEKLSVPIIRRMLFNRALKEKKIYKKYYHFLTTQEKRYYDRVWIYCFGR